MGSFRFWRFDVPNAEFIQHLTSCQHWLRAYMRALLRNGEQADEVLQRTNLVLWEKAEQFQPGSNFKAWACRVAHFEVLAYRKQQSRDRLVFSEAAIAAIGADAQGHIGVINDLREFLEACLAQLPVKQRRLVAARYHQDATVQGIAQQQGTTADAISASLYRIRQTLLKCIQRKLKLRDGV